MKPGTLAERTIGQSAMSTVDAEQPSARMDDDDASASATPATSARMLTRSVGVAQPGAEHELDHAHIVSIGVCPSSSGRGVRSQVRTRFESPP